MAKKKSRGKRPDYRVAALNTKTEERGNIGAAWVQDDGRIGIKFNPFLALEGSLSDYIISLFPCDDDREDFDKELSEPGDAPF